MNDVVHGLLLELVFSKIVVSIFNWNLHAWGNGKKTKKQVKKNRAAITPNLSSQHKKLLPAVQTNFLGAVPKLLTASY